MVSITSPRTVTSAAASKSSAPAIRVTYRVPEWAKNVGAFALLMAIGLALVVIAVDGIRIP